MLYQASTLRPLLNMREYPEHIVIYTMRRTGVSDGLVELTYQSDFEHGQSESVALEWTREVPIMGSSLEFSFLAFEYVVPLWNLVDRYGRRSTTGGFQVQVRSAFRQGGTNYRERQVSFWVSFPVDGGGIVRFADFDIANPTLNPRAPLPLEGPSREDLREQMRDDGEVTRVSTVNLARSYNRVHQLASPPQVDAAAARRAQRLANFDFQEVAGTSESAGAHRAQAGTEQQAIDRIDEKKKQHPPRKPRFNREDPI